jgi:2,3-dihydroxybenzoate decarboxylase
MRRVALEEAFWMEGLQTKGSFGDQRTMFKPSFMEGIRTHLVDFTERRLPEMDRLGVDVQVLSMTAPGLQMQPDAQIAVDDAREANDFLADVVGKYPDRFAGFAALPLQDPDAATAELERCVQQLGFKGALVNDHTLGHYLDEPQYEPVWTQLESLDVPLYIHPGVAFDQWHLLEGRPELKGAMWSWQATTGAHAMRVLFGRVFDRHPGAKIIVGHMGEFLPFQLTRFDEVYSMLDVAEPLKLKPSEYFGRNIMITTTGVYSHETLLAAIAVMGIDNVMWSIDYPYANSDAAVEFLNTAPLSPGDLTKFAHGNADRLLRLK